MFLLTYIFQVALLQGTGYLWMIFVCVLVWIKYIMNDIEVSKKKLPNYDNELTRLKYIWD